ncbi:MAG: sulfatase [Planctomycetes bacterium]|nr:sulfatase [Planctomycetota bacterium]
MKSHFVIAALGLLLLASCGGSTPKKNVVVIVIDTLRADRMSLHGCERNTTPAIDEWAKEGVIFDRANSASSWTVPSMGMLLTGRYRQGSGKTFTSNQRLLSQVLQAAGYRTIGIVANPVLNSLQGFDAGYEQYELTEGSYEAALTERRWGWPSNVVVDKGIRWMREFRDERPFMLYLHLMDPHYPYAPQKGVPFSWKDDLSKERRDHYEGNLSKADKGAIDDELYKRMEQQLAAYDTEILETDQELERLFTYLKESGLSEDTLVVLTSDHGEGLWEHSSKDGWVNEGSFTQSIVPELYRGHGEQLYGELVHVPLVFVGPGVPKDLRDTRTVSLVDVVPTILSLVDIASPTELHGIPLFGDPTLDARDEVFSHCARGTSVTVDGRWKLHLPEDRIAERGGMTALFDLNGDPGENSPIDDPALTRELTARIRAWKERYGEVGDKMSIDEQRKLLLQMGYVGLANELDEDTTQEEIRDLMKEGRRKKARAEAKILNEAAKREGATAGD